MEPIETLDTRSKSKMILFYFVSLFLFAPMGLYSIFKNENFGKKRKINMVILYVLSSYFYLSFYFQVPKELKTMTILINLIGLAITYFFYELYLNSDPTRVETKKKAKALKEEKRYENSQSFKIMSLHNYVETGEIFTFEYMGANDDTYHERNVVVNRVYEKNGYTYIDAYDTDIDDDRCFRTDRML